MWIVGSWDLTLACTVGVETFGAKCSCGIMGRKDAN